MQGVIIQDINCGRKALYEIYYHNGKFTAIRVTAHINRYGFVEINDDCYSLEVTLEGNTAYDGSHNIIGTYYPVITSEVQEIIKNYVVQ